MGVSKPDPVFPSPVQLPSHLTVLALPLQLWSPRSHPAVPVSLVASGTDAEGFVGGWHMDLPPHWATSPSDGIC